MLQYLVMKFEKSLVVVPW